MLFNKGMSVQNFYFTITYLLDQLVLTKSNELKACGAYTSCREEQ